jgi:hypothetical protein
MFARGAKPLAGRARRKIPSLIAIVDRNRAVSRDAAALSCREHARDGHTDREREEGITSLP